MVESSWRPRLIVFCGSVTRHEGDIMDAARRACLHGVSVYFPVRNSRYSPEVLAARHWQMIEAATEVRVVCPDGRVGESTAAEVRYAWELGKTVRVQSPQWMVCGEAMWVNPSGLDGGESLRVQILDLHLDAGMNMFARVVEKLGEPPEWEIPFAELAPTPEVLSKPNVLSSWPVKEIDEGVRRRLANEFGKLR